MSPCCDRRPKTPKKGPARAELRCRGQQEAHIRALLLRAASSMGLGLRRLTSENLEDSPQLTVSALLVSASRNDAALEQIIGRMSLEPFITAAHWQAEPAAAESWVSGLAARLGSEAGRDFRCPSTVGF